MPNPFEDFLAVPPRDVLIVTDYDGTIAAIVADPARAVPTPGVIEHLTALAPLVKHVAVLSGRSEGSLRSFLPIPGIALIGENGILALTPDEDAHLREFKDRAKAVAARWAGVMIEAKQASVSVHFRLRHEIAGELEQALAELIAGSGLTMVANRMVFDIQSRRGSKVRTMGRLIREIKPGAVLYAGDSRDDARVHRCLREATLPKLCIGVASDEMPVSLFRHANLILDGPAGVADLFAGLVRQWSKRAAGLRPV